MSSFVLCAGHTIGVVTMLCVTMVTYSYYHGNTSLYTTSKCTCPVVQGVGRVAKCMLMCMHGSYRSYHTDLLYAPMVSYVCLCLPSILCLPSPICLPIVSYVYLVLYAYLVSYAYLVLYAYLVSYAYLVLNAYLVLYAYL